MGKVKTRNLIAKRIRITKNGKVLRLQGFRRHLNAKKTSKRKRSLKKTVEMKNPWAKKIKKIMGK